MRYLTIGNIVVYHTIINFNTLNKIADCIEFKIIKS